MRVGYGHVQGLICDRGHRHQRRRQNGVAYPYMGSTSRHFHIVFDVYVLDLSLSIVSESAFLILSLS